MAGKIVSLFQRLVFLFPVLLLAATQACTKVCDAKCSNMERGITAYKQKDLTQAEEAFRLAIKTDPKLPEAYNNLGVTLVEQQKLDEAIAAFRQSLKLAPNYGEAQANLGYALEQGGHQASATAEFTKNLPASPDPKRATLSLELGLPGGRGVLAEKIAELQQQVDDHPNQWMPRYNLGIALDEQGDLEGAIASYKQAIAFNPTYAEAYGNLGNALVLAGHKEEGLNYMQRCRDLFEQQHRHGDVKKAELLIEQLKLK